MTGCPASGYLKRKTVLSYHACTDYDEHHSMKQMRGRKRERERKKNCETSRHQATDQFIFYQLYSFKYASEKKRMKQRHKPVNAKDKEEKKFCTLPDVFNKSFNRSRYIYTQTPVLNNPQS